MPKMKMTGPSQPKRLQDTNAKGEWDIWVKMPGGTKFHQWATLSYFNLAWAVASRIAEIDFPGSKVRIKNLADKSERPIYYTFKHRPVKNPKRKGRAFLSGKKLRVMASKSNESFRTRKVKRAYRKSGYRVNPTQRIRSLDKRASADAKARYQRGRLRGKARVQMLGGTLGDANWFVVQVRAGRAWKTLAGFPKGEFGHAKAREYGKMHAARFPRRQFRIHWPDEK